MSSEQQDQLSHFGFKRLTSRNWLEPDPVSALLTAVDRDTGEVVELTGQHWLEEILFLKLPGSVPEHVHALFEVARGAMVYAWFFYPLYTLGTEQLTRVGEAAIAHRWDQVDGPQQTKNFGARVKWLRAHGHLSEEEEHSWDLLRKLRNSASHPRRQTIISQNVALSLMRRVVQDIGRLFEQQG